MSLNILIIDDSMTDFVMMKSILRNSNHDYNIYHNKTGLGVVEEVMEYQIDLIILDLLFDAASGLEVLAAIKSIESLSTIPVIICSSLGDKETLKETLTLGAYDYFEKPLNQVAIEFGFALKVKNALEMKDKTDYVNFLETHDGLTGLRTRKHFEISLKECIENNQFPLSVIMMDVDGLKVINEAYGHDYGDQVLKVIATKLSKIISNKNHISRWGGDEFLVLLPKYNDIDIEDLILDIEEEFGFNTDLQFNVTFGWATESFHSKKSDMIVQKAEDSLYSNKLLEKNSSRSKQIDTILRTLHEKNPREEMHSHRVSAISEAIATEMGFSRYEIKRVKLAGLLHDIGKISIDEKILNKPGRLTEEEFSFIRKHPEHGFKILSTSIETLEISNAVLAHHERWDGKGYPKGMEGTDIPIMARIISVADTFDAITSKRSYKEAISEEEAVEEILRHTGKQFDPEVVKAFLNTLDKRR